MLLDYIINCSCEQLNFKKEKGEEKRKGEKGEKGGKGKECITYMYLYFYYIYLYFRFIKIFIIINFFDYKNNFFYKMLIIVSHTKYGSSC